MKHQHTTILTVLVMVQALILGAPESQPGSRVIGIRSGLDGAEFYYGACSQLLEDARSGNIVSEATPQCGNLTPLHIAIIREPDLVAGLLEAGADVETIGTSISALHLALQSGEFAIANELLAAGADPFSVPNDAGWTTLHSLYSSGRSEDAAGVTRRSLAEYLMHAGVDIDSANAAGMAPIQVAALSVDGVGELLDLGARADLRDAEGIPADFYAALQGDIISAERLRTIAGNPVDFTLENGQNRQEWVESTRRDLDELQKNYPANTEIVADTPSGLSFKYGRCHDRCRSQYNADMAACRRNAQFGMVWTGIRVVGNLAFADPTGAFNLGFRGYVIVRLKNLDCTRKAERGREDCWDECDSAVGLAVGQ